MDVEFFNAIYPTSNPVGLPRGTSLRARSPAGQSACDGTPGQNFVGCPKRYGSTQSHERVFESWEKTGPAARKSCWRVSINWDPEHVSRCKGCPGVFARHSSRRSADVEGAYRARKGANDREALRCTDNQQRAESLAWQGIESECLDSTGSRHVPEADC